MTDDNSNNKKPDDSFPEETDPDKTVATNIDEEPTVVIAPAQKGVENTNTSTTSSRELEITSSIDEEPTVVEKNPAEPREPEPKDPEPKEDTDKTEVKIDLGEKLFSPALKDREDPRKIRSVAGTFKVYTLRKGKHEGFVFEGLRKKDYTEAEIRAGYEQYLEEKENYKPTLFEKLRAMITNLLNKKD